jgi:acyl carrier protein
MEFEKLQQVIADVLSIDEGQIKPETTFVQDLGADSLDVMEIIMRLEDEFGVQVPDEAIENIVTVGDAEEMIKKLK